ncbi:MAG TPA: hypothetical protein DEP72_06750 [Clostridiales bacterium]|nr:MAG: hypothetical protein A2Y18_02510 [Clostridiales bacterium GWD2_32_19]HCC07838.1 hypothetical protein [Clostridiales bacterium]
MKYYMKRFLAIVISICFVISSGLYIPTTVDAATIWNYGYIGSQQTFTASIAGKYLLEVWGAQGGNGSGGTGGYSKGEITLAKNDILYVYVGGSNGYNGGGSGHGRSSDVGGGGTDIRKGSTSIYNRIIVAGGGGGIGPAYGGVGGGAIGGTGGDHFGTPGSGGTQSSGGYGGSNYGNSGSLGQGGSNNTDSRSGGGGGGGGYYGGGSGGNDYSRYRDYDDSGAGGGSGYIGGVSGGYMLSGERYGSGYARITQLTVIDTTAPVISLSATPTALTNGLVTINCIITDDNAITVKKWAVGNQTLSYFTSSGTNLSGTSFTVSTNGVYTVYAKDEFGNAAVKTITISNIDNNGPTITFNIPTNNEISYQTLVNMTITDQGGITKYRYKWMSNPPSSLMGEAISPIDLDLYMGYWSTLAENPTIKAEQLQLNQIGQWYLFVQAVDVMGNISSTRLDEELKMDTLAPKEPSITVSIDENGVMQTNWTAYSEYSQSELDQINSELGYNYTTTEGKIVNIKSDGNVSIVSSGFGEMRLYVQKWGKVDGVNYGWYNILKSGEYIRITNQSQVSQQITNTMVNDGAIDGNGARYRVKIRQIDKAGLYYIIDNGIKDEWDKTYAAQKFKDTALSPEGTANIETMGNIADSGWEETYAKMGAVVLQYQVIPGVWHPSEGRGQIKLTWVPVARANGYYVEIYDGNQWSRFDAGDTTTWDSSQGKIYPSESVIASKTNNSVSTEIYLHNKTGLDLRDNPNNIYKKTIGTGYDAEMKYSIRVIPYISEITRLINGQLIEERVDGPIGPQSVAIVELIHRTDKNEPTGLTEVAYVDNYTASTITVRMTDIESGPKDITGPSGATLISTAVNGQYMTKVFRVTGNGTYNFTIKDNVDRFTVVTAEVKNINPNKPIIIFNREEKTFIEMHLPSNTQSPIYTKYGYTFGSNSTPIANITLVNSAISIKLEINPSSTNYTIPYYIKLQNASGSVLNKKYNVTITGDRTDIKEVY